MYDGFVYNCQIIVGEVSCKRAYKLIIYEADGNLPPRDDFCNYLRFVE